MSRKIFALILTFFALNAWAATSPVGTWKTVDDVSGRVRSIVKITESGDHTLMGRILQTFPLPGVKPLKVCSACSGSLHDQPIIGMVILTGLHEGKDNEWTGGEITDPTNGKTYHCTLKPNEDGSKLDVRGYIGFSLFGRTQTWLRAN
jgi:uncharacterized protein (DUF2147 family)